MILRRNEVKWFKSLRKFRAPLIVSFTEVFINLPSMCTLSESSSRSPVLRLYPRISKNTESDFSTTQKSLPVEKETIEYWLTSHSFWHYSLSNSMGMWKFRGHPQTTRCLGIPIRFSVLGSCLSPFHLFYKEDFT